MPARVRYLHTVTRLWLCCLLLTALCCCAGTSPAFASPPGEYCPASIAGVVPVHPQVSVQGILGTDTIFAYRLRADAPGIVSGRLRIYSARRTFSLEFANVELKPVQHDVDAKNLHYATYDSEPFYFAFVEPVAIAAAWVSRATSSSAPPSVCSAVPIVAPMLSAAPDPIQSWVDPDTGALAARMRDRAPATAPFVTYEGNVDIGNCRAVFEPARMTKVTPPVFPKDLNISSTRRGDAIVKVAVDKKGVVTNTSLYASSGYKIWDGASALAARTATYTPASLLCVPLPGYFLFESAFSK